MAGTGKRASATGRIGHVLLVEDDALLAMALEDALKDAGAERVSWCATVARTMAALENEKPDTVVLDVHLSDADDGWALAELIPQLGLRNVQIVFSTGAPDDIPEDIAALGPIFEKPYDPAKLVDAIRSRKGAGLIARLRDALS